MMDGALTTDVAILMTAAVADEASTSWALKNCSRCQEVGAFREPAVRYVAKAVVVATAVAGASELRKHGHKRAAKFMRWVPFVLWVGVAAHNVHTGRSGR